MKPIHPPSSHAMANTQPNTCFCTVSTAVHGAELTPLQRQTYEQTLNAGKPVRASDLLSVLKPQIGSLTPTAVYHALEVLVAGGYLHKIKTLNAFLACAHPGEPHEGQFLICEHCGKAIELHNDKLATELRAIAEANGFVTHSQVIEISGHCTDCRAKISAS